MRMRCCVRRFVLFGTSKASKRINRGCTVTRLHETLNQLIARQESAQTVEMRGETARKVHAVPPQSVTAPPLPPHVQHAAHLCEFARVREKLKEHVAGAKPGDVACSSLLVRSFSTYLKLDILVPARCIARSRSTCEPLEGVQLFLRRD